jgi:arsenate reductase
VTLVAATRRELPAREAVGYVVAQIAGGLAGVAVANVMFGVPAWTSSSHPRSGSGVLVGEVVATAGLLLVIVALTRTGRIQLVAVAVPAWIGAAYFFTASTSFANPAVTIARSVTDTFAGIAPAEVAPFVAAQIVGAAMGAAAAGLLYSSRRPEPRAATSVGVPSASDRGEGSP